MSLGLMALLLAIGAAVALVLTLVSPGLTDGWALTGAFAIASVTCAVVTLERHGRQRAAVTAVVLASTAGVIAIAAVLPPPDLEAHVYGYASAPGPDNAADTSVSQSGACPTSPSAPAGVDQTFYDGSMYAADHADSTAESSATLDYGTTVTLLSTATGAQIMTMTAAAPVDVTDAATSASLDPPTRGAYIAVAVTYADPTEEARKCFRPSWPSTWWLTDAGDEIELANVSIPGYPRLEDGATQSDNSLTYYDIFDVDPSTIATGRFEVPLLNPDSSLQTLYWGEAPR